MELDSDENQINLKLIRWYSSDVKINNNNMSDWSSWNQQSTACIKVHLSIEVNIRKNTFENM